MLTHFINGLKKTNKDNFMQYYLTKEEFAKELKFTDMSPVYRLIREKKIVLNNDGLIDMFDKINAKYIENRRKFLSKKNNIQQETEVKQVKCQKSADQLALEIDLLNARLEEKKQKSELTRIKIAKENREVVETEVLNRCIQETFGEMIKRLTEIPSVYAIDIIKMIKSEENPKELVVEFLTQKITNTLKLGLQAAKTAAKKYYGEMEAPESKS